MTDCTSTSPLPEGFGVADEVKITTLVDNYVDSWLVSEPGVARFPMSIGRMGLFLLAEHGLSLLVEITADGQRHRFVLDAGATENALPHNAELMGLDLSDVDGVIVSHGHPDHVGGMELLLGILADQRRVPVLVHPDAFHDRWLLMANGEHQPAIHVPREEWEAAGGEIVLVEGPRRVAEGAWVTGAIPRVTDFEKGMLAMARYRDPQCGEFIPDGIRDDQALVVNVRGKGLVVIAGCCHAGIINTVRYAQKLAGVETVHAVLGGLHLSHPTPMATVERTIDELVAIAPSVIVPTHCTGFKAIEMLANRMPDSFLVGAVGSTFVFGADAPSQGA